MSPLCRCCETIFWWPNPASCEPNCTDPLAATVSTQEVKKRAVNQVLVRMLKKIAAASPIRPAVRIFTHAQALPLGLRRQVFLGVARHIPLDEASWFDHEYQALSFRLRKSGSAVYLYWLGSYEPETLGPFLGRARSARVVLDIGARDGLFAIFAAAANPAAKVFAFEPDPSSFAVLESNLGANEQLHVTASAMALSDTSGEATFYLSGGTSSLNPDFRSNTRHALVDVVRGDDFLQAHAVEGIDLIKVDTESTEPAVLRGLETVITRDRPEIICEVLAGRTEPQLEELMGRYGYELYWLTSDGPRQTPRIVGDKTYRHPNYLFSHPSSPFNPARR